MEAKKLYELANEVEERIGTKTFLDELEVELGTDNLEYYINSICRAFDIHYDEETGEIIEDEEE